MKLAKLIPYLLLLCSLPSYSAEQLNIQNDSPIYSHKDYQNLWQAGQENWLAIGGLFAGITYLGAKEWAWGSAEFKFNNEGWFGLNTGSGGADKLGHLYSAYAMNEFLTYQMAKKGYNPESAALYSAYYAWGLMLYVEVFDGYSKDHGFSSEDLIANTTGIGISYLKTKYPDILGDTLDLRIEYSPSDGMEGFHPVTDYSGMKYIAVTKLNGFDAFKNTPLKYFELQLGYQTRGFKKDDRPYTNHKTTETFVGISINLDELIFKPYKKELGRLGQYIQAATHYIQVPGISARTAIHERKLTVN